MKSAVKCQTSSRSPALDIIRCVACFGVVLVHSFQYNGFIKILDLPDGSGVKTALVLLRILSMYCVPLFLLLSGYLLCQKKCTASYYRKAGKTYFIYVAASLFCVFAYPFLYTHLSGRLGLSYRVFDPVLFFRDVFLKILDFTAAPYAWYVEMYLGLFLMAPFLNLLYQAIASKRQKMLLLAVGIVLTILPSLLNVYLFTVPGWWRDPSVMPVYTLPNGYQKLIPQWWTQMYPLTYYFLGCYFREYKINIRPWKCLVLAVVTVALAGLLSLWRPADMGIWCEWNSFFNLLLSSCIFLFFLNLDYTRMPQRIKSVFAGLSDLCLGAYLVSWVFDQLFYPALDARIAVWESEVWYFFAIVPLVFLCSMAVSYCIMILYRLTNCAINHIFPRKNEL